MGRWFDPDRAQHVRLTLALLAILLLSSGLRLYRLGDQGIWWDEGHAIWAARQGLVEATRITAHDVHPPLYLWLLYAWLRLAGDSEFAVRCLSAIGGVLTVALSYVVARRLIGQRPALLAALLMATARFHIWWSQEARMYVWATLFALLSMYLFTRLRQGGMRVWGLFVLASAAALYTLYLAALILLIENLFVALTVWKKPGRRRFLFHWILSQLSVAALYAPWLYLALSRTRTDVARTPLAFYQVWQLYGTVLATGISTDLDRYTWLLAAFGLLAAAGIGSLIADRSQPQRYGLAGWEIGLLLALPLALPPLAVYALSIPRGFFYSPKPEARYLLLFAPFFYILIGGTIAGFWPRGGGSGHPPPAWRRLAAILSAALVLGTFAGVLPAHYAGRYLRNDYQLAMCALAAYAQPGDAVLLVSGDRYPVFLYHYQRRFPRGDGPAVYLMPRHSAQFTPENVAAELAPLHGGHGRLWLASLERALQDPENLVEGWLEAQRRPVFDLAQGHNFLRLYERACPFDRLKAGSERSEWDLPAAGHSGLAVDPAAARPQHPLHHDLGGGVLLGYDLPTAEFRPGDVVQVGLYVQAADALDLAVHWVDGEGQVLSPQVLSVPPSLAGEEGGPQIRWVVASLAIYEYTPPGPYWLEVRGPGDGAGPVRLAAGHVTHSRRLPRRAPAMQHPAEVGGGAVQFLGYGLHPRGAVRPGGALTVDLYWQARRALDTEYTVFIHLLGPYNPVTGGPVWAQDDSGPLGGGHPTTRWLPGQVVPDRHRLEIPAGTPPGTYQIEVGLYDVRTGVRLAVAGDQASRILIADVQVTGDP